MMNDKNMNPSRVIVDASVYVRSHGKQPRGHGSWAFSPEQNPTEILNPDKVYITTGSYGEAKKAAQCRFAGRVVIYVQP